LSKLRDLFYVSNAMPSSTGEAGLLARGKLTERTGHHHSKRGEQPCCKCNKDFKNIPWVYIGCKDHQYHAECIDEESKRLELCPGCTVPDQPAKLTITVKTN
ncbi:hypothetical protein PCANC_23645, partial [Puccinia coronata f. sp. avenae]